MGVVAAIGVLLAATGQFSNEYTPDERSELLGRDKGRELGFAWNSSRDGAATLGDIMDQCTPAHDAALRKRVSLVGKDFLAGCVEGFAEVQ